MSSLNQEDENQSYQELSENSTDDEAIQEMEMSDATHELALATDADMHENELIVEDHGEEVEHEEMEVEEQVLEEIESEEVEIHSETQNIIEEAPPRKSKANVPPLRLLNIAPKPEKLPISVKQISNQPLILVPGTAGGQAIRLVSPQGQGISLANYSIGRPITVKQAPKTQTVTTLPKQLFMKKIITTNNAQKTMAKPLNINKASQQLMVIHKANDGTQQIKILPSSPQKITVQQAQELGILGGAKIVHHNTNKRTVMINKNQPKAIKLIPQSVSSGSVKTISLGQIKSPTRILPASAVNSIAPAKGPQRILLKSAANQVLPAGQLIQVAGPANGQIHQINVPGKGVQYIKFVSSSSADTPTSTVTLVNSIKTVVSSSMSTGILPDMKPVVSTATKLMSKPSTPTSKPTQVMLVPAGYISSNTMQQLQKVNVPTQPVTKQALPPKPKPKSPSPERVSPSPSPSPPSNPPPTSENAQNQNNGMRPRKPCNCTKSQCLKLYCDCFANGEFCYMCNCMNCFNNLENEDTRNYAIKSCLERNPYAFRPKIGKAKDLGGDISRKHTKGCNCKRSGCLKNYCECYEAKIACSNNCKCIGCRNFEDALDNRGSVEVMNSIAHRISDEDLAETIFRKILPHQKEQESTPHSSRSKKSFSRKQPITFITDEVIEATCHCLLTISDEADQDMQPEELTKRHIIEEFAGCLNEIIHCSIDKYVS